MAQQHSLSRPKEIQLICEKCLMSFSRSRDRLRHIDETHGGRKFCPLECGYGTNRGERLQQHLMKIHEVSKIEAKSLVTSNIQRERQSTSCPTVQNTEDLVDNISSSNTSDTCILSRVQAHSTDSFTFDTTQQLDDQLVQEELSSHTYTEMLNEKWN